MNKMLAESCLLDKVCTRSAFNTGWEAVAQWNEMSDYRSGVGLTHLIREVHWQELNSCVLSVFFSGAGGERGEEEGD